MDFETSFDFSPEIGMDIAPSVEIPLDFPALDINFTDASFGPIVDFPESAYEGSMEWTDGDQAAFEGAVVEMGSPDSSPTPVHTSAVGVDYATGVNNILVSNSEQNIGLLLQADLMIDKIHSEPFFREEGFLLSSLDQHPAQEELDTANLYYEKENSLRTSALKYLASELGLMAEDVLAEDDDQIIIDTRLRAYSLADLPRPPVKNGDLYLCEGTMITQPEADRVIAARHWAEVAANHGEKNVISTEVYESLSRITRNACAVAVKYDFPAEEAVRVTVKPSTKTPSSEIERVDVMGSSGGHFLARVSSAEAPVMPAVRKTSESMGYAVEQYEYLQGHGQSVDYNAILEQSSDS